MTLHGTPSRPAAGTKPPVPGTEVRSSASGSSAVRTNEPARNAATAGSTAGTLTSDLETAVNLSFQPSQRAVLAAGQPISELMAQALANPKLISLAAGFVDEATLPVGATRQAMEAIFSDPAEARASLQYGSTHGNPHLRSMILDRHCSENGLQVNQVPSLDQVVVTAGSNQLLHLVFETLCDPGDIVLCSSPTYLVILGTLANLGVRTVGIETDDDGLIPGALEEALDQLEAEGQLSRVKAIYLVPYFDNPGGITMPFDRVNETIAIARRWSQCGTIHVIADEAYRELRYDAFDVPGACSVDDSADIVITAGTFSKSFSPGIRVGWGVLPQHLIQPVCNQKGNIDFGSPHFNQQIMAKVLDLGLYEPHIEQIRRAYSEKMRAMLEAADEHLGPLEGVRWSVPQGGLYVWAEFPDHLATGPGSRLLEAAIAEGVLYVPGQYTFPTEGTPIKPNTMRLSFGVQSCHGIEEGIKALARAVQPLL